MAAQQSIESAEALFRKLERSFYRRPAYGDSQLDWVFDVVVTAWHLVDWVASERTSGGSRKAQVAAFKARCAELAVCEQVCNGVKHLVLDNPQLKPFNVARDVRATDDLLGMSRPFQAGEGPIDVVLTPYVSITDMDGRAWAATTLLHRVLSFWRAELGIPS